MFIRRLVFILPLFLITACAVTKNNERLETLTETTYNDLPGWETDDHSEALAAFKKSCAKIKTNPQTIKTSVETSARNWVRVCSKIKNDTIAKDFFEDNFTPYIATKNKDALFTAYFESELNGSLEKKPPYIYPIYRRPIDLKPDDKYLTRAKINNGALEGKNLEIAWVDDPVRLFFLHVQGSGRIKLNDGSILNIGFAGKNNQEYVSIGKYLAQRTGIPPKEMSKEKIEEWLKAHPLELNNVLEKNPSYIFFRRIAGEGPIGGQGVALTPMRSVAIDNKIINYGTPIWVDTKLASGANSTKNFQHLLIAQDTGSAIKGPLRLDIFLGAGADAEYMAGYQNHPGRYFLLLPNN